MGSKAIWANPGANPSIFHDAVVEKMTLYRSIACSILLTVTIAETVPDAKQAFEKYVKERDFTKGICSCSFPGPNG